MPLGIANEAVCASAVTLYWSAVSAVGVIVAAEVIVPMRAVMRLLVNVWVSVVPTTVPDGAATVVPHAVPEEIIGMPEPDG